MCSNKCLTILCFVGSLSSSQTCFLLSPSSPPFSLFYLSWTGFEYGSQVLQVWSYSSTLESDMDYEEVLLGALPLEGIRQFSSSELFVEKKRVQPIPHSCLQKKFLPPKPSYCCKASTRWSSPELSQVRNRALNSRTLSKRNISEVLELNLVYMFLIPALRRWSQEVRHSRLAWAT